MLWLVTKKSSHQIVSSNLFEEENGKHSLWVERANGKNMKIVESDKVEDVKVYQDAIKHAIKVGERVLELDV